MKKNNSTKAENSTNTVPQSFDCNAGSETAQNQCVSVPTPKIIQSNTDVRGISMCSQGTCSGK